MRRKDVEDDTIDGGFLLPIEFWLPIVCGKEDVRQGRVYTLKQVREMMNDDKVKR